MRILLINVPHPSIGSRIPDDHLPPLGLLSIGSPLIDDGHDVTLLDAEFGPMPPEQIVAEALRMAPDIVMFGHSGSTSGHPVIETLARRIHAGMPMAKIIYGGVYPTYHWREILEAEPHVFLDRHVRIERIGLEHHRHPAFGGIGPGHVASANCDHTRRGLLEPRDHPQQR